MLLVALLLMAGSGAVPEAEVLAQLRAGKMLCVNPDPDTKTCSAIDRYVAAADGGFVDTGEVLLSVDQAITLEVTSTVRVENGAICGALRLADLQKARVRVNGALMPPARRAQVVATMMRQMKPLAGRKACETLRMEDGQLLKYGRVEGVDVDLPGKPVSWITRDAGYRVAPG